MPEKPKNVLPVNTQLPNDSSARTQTEFLLGNLWEVSGRSFKSLTGLWEVSGKSLGHTWEASGRLVWPWEAQGRCIPEIGTILARNAKVVFVFNFGKSLLNVGVTKYSTRHNNQGGGE